MALSAKLQYIFILYLKLRKIWQSEWYKILHIHTHAAQFWFDVNSFPNSNAWSASAAKLWKTRSRDKIWWRLITPTTSTIHPQLICHPMRRINKKTSNSCSLYLSVDKLWRLLHLYWYDWSTAYSSWSETNCLASGFPPTDKN